MSAESNTKAEANGALDPVSSMIAFWTQWMDQTARGTQALLEAMQAVGDPTALQKKWVDTMSESAENFMRTPVFMELMRRHLKLVTDMKMMQNNVVHGAARDLGVPLADDITGLFERINSTEMKIIKRLQAIEDRLDAMESKGSGAGPKKRVGQARRTKS
jgi:hypothetical protein